MLQLGLVDGNGIRYSIAKVIAAALVLVSLTDEFNLASALIQVIWIVIGVSGLALRALRCRPMSQSNLGLRSNVLEAYEIAKT